MKAFLNRIKGAKTTYAGLSAVVTGAFMIYKNPGQLEQGMLAIIGGLSMIFARDAISKVTPEKK